MYGPHLQPVCQHCIVSSRTGRHAFTTQARHFNTNLALPAQDSQQICSTKTRSKEER